MAADARTTPDSLEDFSRYIDRNRLFSSSSRFRALAEWVFDGVDLRGKRILDIGAGYGLLGTYAACLGAANVVCLEPESDGCVSPDDNARPHRVFARMVAALRLHSVRMLSRTLQDFDGAGGPFDIVVMHQAVNHLDEAACMRLHEDENARERYRAMFRKIFELTSPRGTLILQDCARRNLFADFGLRNPFAPTIEWDKHQGPELWSQLLAGAGYKSRRPRWTPPNRTGRLGQLLLANRVVAYGLRSDFSITAVKH